MTIISRGDLEISYQLRRENARLSTELARITREISTGRVADVARRTNGDLGPVADIESGLTRIAALDRARNDALLETSSRQSAIASIRDLGNEAIGALLMVQDTADATLVRTTARDAAGRFASVLATLNTAIGGRSLFAGTAVDGPAVADMDTIMTALQADLALVAPGTPDAIRAAVEAWFAPGGGFHGLGYIGSTTSLAPLDISSSEKLATLPRADDVRILDTLASYAMAALVDAGALALSPDEQGALLKIAGETLLEADRGLVDLQAELGMSEGRLDRAKVENAAERDMLELARSRLVGVDPFDAATELQAVEIQLESLYAVTARLSRLSLTDYLR